MPLHRTRHSVIHKPTPEPLQDHQLRRQPQLHAQERGELHPSRHYYCHQPRVQHHWQRVRRGVLRCILLWNQGRHGHPNTDQQLLRHLAVTQPSLHLQVRELHTVYARPWRPKPVHILRTHCHPGQHPRSLPVRQAQHAQSLSG